MRVRTFVVFLVATTLAAFAAAQTKTSGTLQCGKPDPFQKVDVGDKPDHTLTLSKVACTWTKPFEIAGIATKDGASAATGEMSGDKSWEQGIHYSSMANGDRIFVKYQGSAKLKDGAPQSAEGTWSYTGGTGKMKAIKGKGTYKGGPPAADGSMTFEVEGEYELPK